MYFANNHYLLRYNGVKWENIVPANHYTSIMVDGDKIYSGSYKEFGYWNRKDGKNELCFHFERNNFLMK
jgi:hypothetical protein